MTTNPPVALTIAGSDCSAGAGIQADLKTFQRFGVFGLTAVTCVVAEPSREVGSVHPVPPEILAEQVTMLLRSFPVAALKTGMLFSAAHVEATCRALDGCAAPLVVDPVMIASTGDPLIEPGAIDLYRRLLLPRAAVITPNLDEAAHLLGAPIRCRNDMSAAARRLAAEFRVPVLLKGGHLAEDECTDLLVWAGAEHWFTAPRIPVPASHGTGCTFSAAITAQLALDKPLPAAVAAAKEFLGLALAGGFSWHDPAGIAIHALNCSGGL
jgi:hydroxymethylpyrimidine/phosphomethylpyrimidine kinase